LVTGLNKLSRNLWWSWDQEAQDLFQELSPRNWQNLIHNAAAILREVSEYELRVRLQDADFEQRALAVLLNFEAYLRENQLGHVNAPQLLQNPSLIFSAELVFTSRLPISRAARHPAATMRNPPATSACGFVGVGLFLPRRLFQQAIDQQLQDRILLSVDPKNVPLEPGWTPAASGRVRRGN